MAPGPQNQGIFSWIHFLFLFCAFFCLASCYSKLSTNESTRNSVRKGRCYSCFIFPNVVGEENDTGRRNERQESESEIALYFMLVSSCSSISVMFVPITMVVCGREKECKRESVEPQSKYSAGGLPCETYLFAAKSATLTQVKPKSKRASNLSIRPYASLSFTPNLCSNVFLIEPV